MHLLGLSSLGSKVPTTCWPGQKPCLGGCEQLQFLSTSSGAPTRGGSGEQISGVYSSGPLGFADTLKGVVLTDFKEQELELEDLGLNNGFNTPVPSTLCSSVSLRKFFPHLYCWVTALLILPQRIALALFSACFILS